tara:strand:+ start:3331 stop:3972 length:642 start_codon:yes stop_codon:yes gene_type:complete
VKFNALAALTVSICAIVLSNPLPVIGAEKKLENISPYAGIKKPAPEYARMVVTWPPKKEGGKETVRYFDELGWSHNIRETPDGDIYFETKVGHETHAIYGVPGPIFPPIEEGLAFNKAVAESIYSAAYLVDEDLKSECYEYIKGVLLDPTSLNITAPLKLAEKDILKTPHVGIRFKGKANARNRGGNIVPSIMYCHFRATATGVEFRSGALVN